MLTQTQVKAAKGRPNSYYLTDDDGTRGQGRLVLKIQPSGNKRWFYRYRVSGRMKFKPLGIYPDVSLAMARQLLQQVRSEGVVSDAGTLEMLVDAYLSTGMKTAEDLRRRIEKEVYPNIDITRPASEITTQDILPVLSSMIKRGSPVGANRMRTTLRALFSWGMKADYDPKTLAERSIRFNIKSNPVDPIPADHSVEKVSDRRLTQDELKQLVSVLADGSTGMSEHVRKSLLLMVLLFGQRPTEVLGLRWTDIEDGVIWFRDTKAGNDHCLPVVDAVADVLDSLPRYGDYVFFNRSGESHMKVNVVRDNIKRHLSGLLPHFSPKDIRTTCKSIGADIGLSKDDRDLLQNHNQRSDVSSRHYDFSLQLDKKRELLERWVNFVTR